jgi:hypothetical protein
MTAAETRNDFETPEPRYEAERIPFAVRLTDPRPLAQMANHEIARMRAAASRAPKVYPGAVGQLVSRELSFWGEFGYVLGGNGLVMKLADQVLKTPLPE